MSTATTNNQPASTALATTTEKRITNQVLEQVSTLRAKGAITLPADYNVGNALTAAWLKLQTVANKDGKLVIKNGQVDTSVVSLASVANALHDYVIQGLNVAKSQAYFIVYDTQLVCQRSYHGDMLVARRVMPGIEFDFDTVRKGENLSISKQLSRKGQITTVSHSEIGFPRNPAIVGAYCGVFTEDGECLGYDIMDMDRIKQSWAKSKTYKWSKSDKPSTHDEFPEEMCLRTVIRHRCKAIINSSNDAHLMQAMLRQDLDQVDAEVAEEAEHANSEPLALDAPAVQLVTGGVDQETGEVVEAPVQQKAGF